MTKKTINKAVALESLVDSVVKRSTELKKKAIDFVEDNYSLEKLLHGSYVANFLSHRLALAELSIKEGWLYKKYKKKAETLGIWF